MVIKEPKNAAEECPRFEFCNINKCILNPEFKKLVNDESDTAMLKKDKCIPKSIRVRISKKWGLKHGGLTDREQQARKRWDDLPEEVKQARIKKMQEISALSRLLKKGGKVIPPKTKQSQKPYTKEISSPVEHAIMVKSEAHEVILNDSDIGRGKGAENGY